MQIIRLVTKWSLQKMLAMQGDYTSLRYNAVEELHGLAPRLVKSLSIPLFVVRVGLEGRHVKDPVKVATC